MTTKCDRDRTNNVWVEGEVCLLDTLGRANIVAILQADQRAREDLLRVTSDAELLDLARTVPLLPSESEGDRVQKELNRSADSIPFYTVFRGQPPFNQ